MSDPRPHLGEPLALDLLNTRWMSGDGPQDLLTDLDGLRVWLHTNNLHTLCAADTQTREALLAAREAIYRAVKDSQIDGLNAVLSHGAIRRSLTANGPLDTAEVAESHWLPGGWPPTTYSPCSPSRPTGSNSAPTHSACCSSMTRPRTVRAAGIP